MIHRIATRSASNATFLATAGSARYGHYVGLICIYLWFISGCAAITNPVANGLPVRRLDPLFLGESREVAEMIPLTALRQPPPEVYRLGPGDVLGVYIEGVLGDRGQTPPVHFPDAINVPPALGYPIPIRDDGTVPLPLIEPVRVDGMTIRDAESRIIEAYTRPLEILPPGRSKIIVTLIRPRQTRVLVVRGDTGEAGITFNSGVGFGAARGTNALVTSARSGTGSLIELPAYENDVLHALLATGGLPGPEAENEIVIYRGPNKGQREVLFNNPGLLRPGCEQDWLRQLDGQVIRIPLRLAPGFPLALRPEDVILQTGDIVQVERRQVEVFYAGGLLPSGEYLLPRDYDLDVVEAVIQIGGPVVSGGVGLNNLTGSVGTGGLGRPNPSLLIVLRQTPGGGQVPIRVDLNRALRDPRERILVQPGDMLILQETPGEAIGRYFSEMFDFTIVSRLIQTSRTTGTATLSVP